MSDKITIEEVREFLREARDAQRVSGARHAYGMESVGIAELAISQHEELAHLRAQLQERDTQLAALAPACKTCGGTGMQNDAHIGDISFNEWPCPICGGSGKDYSTLPATAQANARIIEAAEELQREMAETMKRRIEGMGA